VTIVAVGMLPWATNAASIDELLEIIEPPAWHADAACKEAPTEVSWFAVQGQTAAPARAVCQRCLAAADYLT
jgi:hypothetical protein